MNLYGSLKVNKENGKVFQLSSTNCSIGSGLWATIKLKNHNIVDDIHCIVKSDAETGIATLVNKSKIHPTKLNGKDIKVSNTLKDGDIINILGFEFVYENKNISKQMKVGIMKTPKRFSMIEIKTPGNQSVQNSPKPSASKPGFIKNKLSPKTPTTHVSKGRDSLRTRTLLRSASKLTPFKQNINTAEISNNLEKCGDNDNISTPNESSLVVIDSSADEEQHTDSNKSFKKESKIATPSSSRKPTISSLNDFAEFSTSTPIKTNLASDTSNSEKRQTRHSTRQMKIDSKIVDETINDFISEEEVEKESRCSSTAYSVHLISSTEEEDNTENISISSKNSGTFNEIVSEEAQISQTNPRRTRFSRVNETNKENTSIISKTVNSKIFEVTMEVSDVDSTKSTPIKAEETNSRRTRFSVRQEQENSMIEQPKIQEPIETAVKTTSKFDESVKSTSLNNSNRFSEIQDESLYLPETPGKQNESVRLSKTPNRQSFLRKSMRQFEMSLLEEDNEQETSKKSFETSVNHNEEVSRTPQLDLKSFSLIGKNISEQSDVHEDEYSEDEYYLAELMETPAKQRKSVRNESEELEPSLISPKSTYQTPLKINETISKRTRNSILQDLSSTKEVQEVENNSAQKSIILNKTVELETSVFFNVSLGKTPRTQDKSTINSTRTTKTSSIDVSNQDLFDTNNMEESLIDNNAKTPNKSFGKVLPERRSTRYSVKMEELVHEKENGSMQLFKTPAKTEISPEKSAETITVKSFYAKSSEKTPVKTIMKTASTPRGRKSIHFNLQADSTSKKLTSSKYGMSDDEEEEVEIDVVNTPDVSTTNTDGNDKFTTPDATTPALSKSALKEKRSTLKRSERKIDAPAVAAKSRRSLRNFDVLLNEAMDKESTQNEKSHSKKSWVQRDSRSRFSSKGPRSSYGTADISVETFKSFNESLGEKELSPLISTRQTLTERKLKRKSVMRRSLPNVALKGNDSFGESVFATDSTLQSVASSSFSYVDIKEQENISPNKSNRILRNSSNKIESENSGQRLDTEMVKDFVETEEKENTVSNLEGLKRVLRTPKVQKEPLNDLRNPYGVKKLMKTPKLQKEPENDLSSPYGIKKLMKTPKTQKDPENDLSSPYGVKKLMKTPKTQKDPENDLSSPYGVKKLMKTPKLQKEPENDLSSPYGVKKLMKTPKTQKDPENDLRNPHGLKKLMKTPKSTQKEPKNDLSDIDGFKELFENLKPDLNVSGISLLNDADEFTLLSQKPVLRTYERKTLSPPNNRNQEIRRKSEGFQAEVNPDVEKWVCEQQQHVQMVLKEKDNEIEDKVLHEEKTEIMKPLENQVESVSDTEDLIEENTKPVTPKNTRRGRVPSVKSLETASKDGSEITRVPRSRRGGNKEITENVVVVVQESGRGRNERKRKMENADNVDKATPRENKSRRRKVTENEELEESIIIVEDTPKVAEETAKNPEEAKVTRGRKRKQINQIPEKVDEPKTTRLRRRKKEENVNTEENYETSSVKSVEIDNDKKITRSRRGRKEENGNTEENEQTVLVKSAQVKNDQKITRSRRGEKEENEETSSVKSAQIDNDKKITRSRRGRKEENVNTEENEETSSVKSAQIDNEKKITRLRRGRKEENVNTEENEETSSVKSAQIDNDKKITRSRRGRKEENVNTEESQEPSLVKSAQIENDQKILRSRRAKKEENVNTEENDETSSVKSAQIDNEKKITRSRRGIKKGNVNIEIEEGEEASPLKSVQIENDTKITRSRRGKKGEVVNSEETSSSAQIESDKKTMKSRRGKQVDSITENAIKRTATIKKLINEETSTEKTDSPIRNIQKSTRGRKIEETEEKASEPEVEVVQRTRSGRRINVAIKEEEEENVTPKKRAKNKRKNSENEKIQKKVSFENTDETDGEIDKPIEIPRKTRRLLSNSEMEEEVLKYEEPVRKTRSKKENNTETTVRKSARSRK